MDRVTKSKRSEIMAKVCSKNTAPEQKVQSILEDLGQDFITHEEKLPGKPDIVIEEHRLVVFVHGCFWHHHDNCKKGTIPKTRKKFWKKKIQANVKRDKQNITKLRELGWRVIVIWGCEISKGLARSIIVQEM